MRKPYFRKDRGAWFVKTRNGKSQIRLHEDEEQAFKIWQELQSAENPDRPNAPFASLVENYLRSAERSVSAEMFTRTGTYLADFCRAYGKTAARAIKPHDVTKWIENHPGWGSWSQRAAISAVKRVFSWAIEQGLLTANPLAKVRRPRGQRREQLISDDQHAAMWNASRAEMRHVMLALRHSGARPGMVAAVTAANVSPDGWSWIMHEHKTRKNTGRPLVIYLSPCLRTLTLALAQKYPAGPLFRDARGNAWNRNSIRCRIRRLRKKLGLPAGIVAYSYRHTFATNAILNGTDLATAAELLGHKGVAMFEKHYGHIGQHNEHLKAAAAMAVRKKA